MLCRGARTNHGNFTETASMRFRNNTYSGFRGVTDRQTDMITSEEAPPLNFNFEGPQNTAQYMLTYLKWAK
jgi:hypothetical protein